MSDVILNASDEVVVRCVEEWLEKAVIGLNLCPFAKQVQRKGLIRYVVSTATDDEALMVDLQKGLATLKEVSPLVVDTLLLIVPHMLADFDAFVDFLPICDLLITSERLDGVVQIAHFHPKYQFEGEAVDAVSNYTNRAPYPIFHLLREDSIERAVDSYPDASVIYERNIKTLEKLGVSGWAGLFNAPQKPIA